MAGNVSLSEQQERAIDLLLEGYSRTAVAERISVGRRTRHRWLNQAPFAGELSRRRAELEVEVRERLVSLRGSALDVLEDVMCDPGATDTARVRAAVEILDRTGLTRTERLEIEHSGGIQGGAAPDDEKSPAERARAAAARLGLRLVVGDEDEG